LALPTTMQTPTDARWWSTSAVNCTGIGPFNVTVSLSNFSTLHISIPYPLFRYETTYTLTLLPNAVCSRMPPFLCSAGATVR
jgi:hypothetical protein